MEHAKCSNDNGQVVAGVASGEEEEGKEEEEEEEDAIASVSAVVASTATAAVASEESKTASALRGSGCACRIWSASLRSPRLIAVWRGL